MDYVAIGAIIISLLGFLVVVIKSTSNKELFLSLKNAIKELKEAIETNTQMQRENFFDFREHQKQSQRTHDELHEVHNKINNLEIEVKGFAKDVQGVCNRMAKNIDVIKEKVSSCDKVKNG